MMKIPFKVGDTLYLQQKSNSVILIRESLTYKARIADLNNEFISIEMPLSEETGKFAFFPEGSEIEIWLYTQDGSKYSFVSLVLGLRRERIPLTLVSHPLVETIIKEQRREFLRVPCYEEVAIHPLKSGDFTPFLAKIVDLSGGGLAFISSVKPALSPDKHIRWWLSLGLNSGPILHPTGTAKLIRIIDPVDQGLPYKCPIEFIDLAEPERQKIIRYCYERQLEIKKKGVK